MNSANKNSTRDNKTAIDKKLPLPVIIGFGGFNCAGQSSFHQSYLRTIYSALTLNEQQAVIIQLAALMKLIQFKNQDYYCAKTNTLLSSEQIFQKFEQQVLEGSLIRKIELFDCQDLEAKSAGQLPTGFEPSDHYKARFHPRGLQLAILAASDAIHSTGFSVEQLKSLTQPDRIGVYAGSALGQLDQDSYVGMIQAPLKNKRVSAKQLALSLNSMPTDFVNAYSLGNLGTTMTASGACASFLYNLKVACHDIQSKRIDIAIVGNSEAPVNAETMQGFIAMSALATEKNLRKIKQLSDLSQEKFARTASRPFAENAGFTIAESGQYIVLMSDSLAIKSGAHIHGAVPEVFTNADGYKKSISSPGAGNYITLAKSVAYAQQMLGKHIVQRHSFVQSHGSSTPANRVTESKILSKVAQTFDIKHWPVTAVKSYLGHPLGPASGDQLNHSLGCFKYGIIPAIQNVKHISLDVEQQNLNFTTEHLIKGQHHWQLSFLNSKGFGGNNATGILLSEQCCQQFLQTRHSQLEWQEYLDKKKTVEQQAKKYQTLSQQGQLNTLYNFGHEIIEEDDITINENSISFEQELADITLDNISRY